MFTLEGPIGGPAVRPVTGALVGGPIVGPVTGALVGGPNGG